MDTPVPFQEIGSSSATPGAPPPLPVFCHKCRFPVEPGARYCSRCGANQQSGQAWYYHPLSVLILGLLVLGPFALILVWKSRRMGYAVKWILATVIIVYSIYCLYYVYVVTVYIVRETIEFNRVLIPYGKLFPCNCPLDVCKSLPE